jgi:hypothetical protein
MSLTAAHDDNLRVTLDDVVNAASDAIDIRTLPSGTTLNVRTRHSEYRLRVCAGADSLVTVRGGRLFQDESPSRLAGSSLGGGLLKVGCVVVGLRLELETGVRRIITSPILSVDVVEPMPHAA